MVILSAQRMQRLAERLQQMERSIEASGGELEDLEDEAARAENALEAEESREVEEGLASAAARMGVEMKTVRAVDADTLIRLLSRGAGGGGGPLWAAAEILYLDGLLARAEGRPEEARARWAKAARLYRRVGPELELPEEAAAPEERLDRIEEWTDDQAS